MKLKNQSIKSDGNATVFRLVSETYRERQNNKGTFCRYEIDWFHLLTNIEMYDIIETNERAS